MTTKAEKRLMVLDNKRKRLAARKAEAAKKHKPTGLLHALHVEATRQLIKAELRIHK